MLLISSIYSIVETPAGWRHIMHNTASCDKPGSVNKKHSNRKMAAILRLSQGSFEKSILARNCLNRVLSMDLDGYFDHVFLVFFKAYVDGTFCVSPRHTVVDVAV